MPVIQVDDPLSSGLAAAGAYQQQKNENDQRAQALALAKEKEQYERGERAKEFDEKKSEFEQSFGLDKERTEATIASQQLHDSIDKAAEEFAAKMRPLQLQQTQLALQVTKGEINETAARTKGLQLANQESAIELEIKKKYGDKAAALGIQQAQANLASTQAQTGLTSAETARTNKETALMGTGFGAGGGGGGRGGAGKIDTDAALNALSDTGYRFYQMLYSTNNPPTPQQALLAIRIPTNGLSPQDRKILEQLVTTKGAGLVTTTNQGAAEARGEKLDLSKQNAAAHQGDAQFAVAEKSKAFKQLPVDDQELVQSAIHSHGYNQSVVELSQIANGAPNSAGITPERATRILKALGVQ